MVTKLILLEGIPGSGKTTFARKIAEWFRRMGITVNLFSEGQSHPADLGWNACVPIALYENIAAAIAATNEHSHPSQIGNCWLL